jgi:hypothetical protein
MSTYEDGWRDCALSLAAEFIKIGAENRDPLTSSAYYHAALVARQLQDGADRPSAPSGVSADAGSGKTALSASPRSCVWCLWDIIQVSGEGRWRLAWWSSSDEAEVADPYHCDGHADGVHVPKAEVAP